MDFCRGSGKGRKRCYSNLLEYPAVINLIEEYIHHCVIKKVIHRSPKLVLPDHTTINSLTNTISKYFADKIVKLRSGLLSTDAVPHLRFLQE